MARAIMQAYFVFQWLSEKPQGQPNQLGRRSRQCFLLPEPTTVATWDSHDGGGEEGLGTPQRNGSVRVQMEEKVAGTKEEKQGGKTAEDYLSG